MLNQDQQAKLPPKIRQVLSREGVREDLGDMGIVVRLRDKQYHMALKRALQWIAMGSAAAFLETRRLDVIKKEGDIKCDWSSQCDCCGQYAYLWFLLKQGELPRSSRKLTPTMLNIPQPIRRAHALPKRSTSTNSVSSMGSLIYNSTRRGGFACTLCTHQRSPC